ncbi:MAG: aldo/keto reductase [Myxococcaceae bacterium]|nr:aldo/keto reductase [Myxococcaceae bacterium]
MTVAAFGLGLAALGRPGYMTLGHDGDLPDTSVSAMRDRCFEVLDEAWRLGLRHVDTARSYGLGEAFLSEWIASRAPTGLVVSSKWGYRYTAGWRRTADVHEVKDHSRAHLDAQWRQSRALLGRALSVYQVHSLTPDSPLLADDDVQHRLAELRDEAGLSLGASVSGPRQGELVDRLVALERNGRRLFDWVQATWNVLERSAGPALGRAHEAGMRVIIKEALANGRLTARGDVEAVTQAARDLQTSPDALALAIARCQPFADVVLCGAASVTQLRSNLSGIGLSVTPDSLSSVTQPAMEYWNFRTQLKWS